MYIPKYLQKEIIKTFEDVLDVFPNEEYLILDLGHEYVSLGSLNGEVVCYFYSGFILVRLKGYKTEDTLPIKDFNSEQDIINLFKGLKNQDGYIETFSHWLEILSNRILSEE